MLADHAASSKPIQFRHADIDQNYRYTFVLEEIFKRLAAGTAATTRFSIETFRIDFIGEKLRRLIIDQQNCDFLVVGQCCSRRSAV